MLRSAASFYVIAIGAFAQGAPVFEAASVKAVAERTGSAGLIVAQTDPAMVRYSNITLKNLAAMAYGVDARLIQGGPKWLDEQLYDVAAKVPEGASGDQVPAMMQALLVERLGLAVHRETTEQRAFFLVAGKSGAKLKPAAVADDQAVEPQRGDRFPIQVLPGGIVGRSIGTKGLAGALALAAGYQVVDRTGLGGIYDIDLRWTTDDGKGSGPDLFTAIQEQLGLKLEAGKVQVEMLVIDRAERVPREN